MVEAVRVQSIDEIVVGWLEFFGISTIVGYITPYPDYIYANIWFVSKWFVSNLISKRFVRAHIFGNNEMVSVMANVNNSIHF